MRRIALVIIACLFVNVRAIAVNDVDSESLYDCSTLKTKRDLYISYTIAMDYYVAMARETSMIAEEIVTNAMMVSTLSSLGELNFSPDLCEELVERSHLLSEQCNVKVGNLLARAEEIVDYLRSRRGWEGDTSVLSDVDLALARRECEVVTNVGSMNMFIETVMMPFKVFMMDNGFESIESDQVKPTEVPVKARKD